VDHLVIGAPGLFTITVFDKRIPPYPRRPADRAAMSSVLRVAQHETRLVSRRLGRSTEEPITAWPVIVVNDGTLDVTKAAGDAYVVAEPLLIPWLKSLMPVFDPEVVATLVDHAGAEETWALGA
jgi:hypothetical protein